MNRCVVMILACCLLGGCGTTTRPSPEADASNKYSIDTAKRRYLDCAFDYANRYAPSNASASEIADAAVATCETHLQDFQRVVTASMVERYDTQLGVQAAREGVRELTRKFRSDTRGTVISKVLELRESGHAPGRAPASPLSDISAADLQTLRKQAARRDASAQYNLGALYASGAGVPQSDTMARQWWEKAAAQGHASAQDILGALYYKGIGVPQDYAMARQWSEKAAAQGDEGAQLRLGTLYHQARGVPQDYVKARQWYEKAAAQGNAKAQYALGVLYGNGQGVPQDYAQARQWYEKAATQGHASAQYNLGALYASGAGVPQSDTMARQWWEKASAQGDAEAQFVLGTLYVTGQGVPQDYVRAYMLVTLAAANLTGDEQKLAADNRDKLASIMTPAQIAEAQRLASQCQARQFKGC